MLRSNNQNRIVFIFDQFSKDIDPNLVLEIKELNRRKVPLSIFCVKRDGKITKETPLQELNGSVFRPNWKSSFFSIWTFVFLLITKLYVINTSLFVLAKNNYKNPPFMIKLLSKFLRIAWITRKICKYPKALIHVQGSYFVTQTAWLISRLTKKPYLITMESENLNKKNGKFMHAISESKGLLTRTKLRKQLLMNSYGKLEIPIWPHYQSTNLNGNEPEETKKDDQFKIIVFCSNEPIVGFNALLDAFVVLAERRVNFQCEFIGCGPTFDRFEYLIYDKCLEHMVIFRDELSEKEMLELMNISSVLVIPNDLVHDPNNGCIPGWVLQAMALELPIIAFNEGIIKEIIKDFVSGILVDPGDSLSLVSAIQTLYYHPEIRKQFGIRAKQLIDSRYNLTININILEEIYRTIGE
jgi:glycosyltransferase involved in cell wall biosynthesis